MTKGITALLTQYKETQRQLRERLKTDGTKLLEESFKELFDKHQGLKVFAYIGYTPSFNDGEPCEHSGYSYVGGEFYKKQYYSGDGWYWCDSWDDRENLGEIFLQNYEDFDSEDGSFVPLLTNGDCLTLKDAEKDVQNFEDAIEMVYGTNYQVIVRLEDDGSVSIEHEDYDCGY